MDIKSRIYNSLPGHVQPFFRRWYCNAVGKLLPATVRSCLERWNTFRSASEEEVHAAFVEDHFESREEYDRYSEEFENSSIWELHTETLETFQSVEMDSYRDYYALIRKHEPTTIVETGVCVGFSSYAMLLALEKNESGQLYSIDYPHYADESLDQFRAETFEGYGGAAIPSDKEPGWIIPDELRDYWNLSLGKSQRELPKLVPEVNQLEMFVHDSEHSHPCMMFEYELAYEWMEEGGLIVSDDISWNEAFPVFVDVRNPDWGRVTGNIGYVVK